VIVTKTVKNGEETLEEQTISGTEEEVKAAVEAMKDVQISIEKE